MDVDGSDFEYHYETSLAPALHGFPPLAQGGGGPDVRGAFIR